VTTGIFKKPARGSHPAPSPEPRGRPPGRPRRPRRRRERGLRLRARALRLLAGRAPRRAAFRRLRREPDGRRAAARAGHRRRRPLPHRHRRARRFPASAACYKLGLRFGRRDMVKRFLASRRTGYYLAVGAEGNVGAGDRVDSLAPPSGPDPGGGDHPRVRERSGRPRDDRAARRPRRSTGRLAKLLREARREE